MNTSNGGEFYEEEGQEQDYIHQELDNTGVSNPLKDTSCLPEHIVESHRMATKNFNSTKGEEN